MGMFQYAIGICRYPQVRSVNNETENLLLHDSIIWDIVPAMLKK